MKLESRKFTNVFWLDFAASEVLGFCIVFDVMNLSFWLLGLGYVAFRLWRRFSAALAQWNDRPEEAARHWSGRFLPTEFNWIGCAPILAVGCLLESSRIFIGYQAVAVLATCAVAMAIWMVWIVSRRVRLRADFAGVHPASKQPRLTLGAIALLVVAIAVSLSDRPSNIRFRLQRSNFDRMAAAFAGACEAERPQNTRPVFTLQKVPRIGMPLRIYLVRCDQRGVLMYQQEGLSGSEGLFWSYQPWPKTDRNVEPALGEHWAYFSDRTLGEA